MKRTYISLGILSFMLICLQPHTTEAYFTTAQSATKITEQAAFFTIEYAFGLEDHDLYMPVIAQRGLLHESDEKKVGYTFREDEEIVTSGTSAGLVLSSAPIVNGMYKIAKGTAQKMILFVILTEPKGSPEMDYSLQVEKLPFYVDTGAADLVMRQLNPSELQYYVTKEIELNSPSE